jgi:hypothetical protein
MRSLRRGVRLRLQHAVGDPAARRLKLRAGIGAVESAYEPRSPFWFFLAFFAAFFSLGVMAGAFFVSRLLRCSLLIGVSPAESGPGVIPYNASSRPEVKLRCVREPCRVPVYSEIDRVET